MNKKILMFALIPLALGMIMTNVSASAEIWYHDVGNDMGSDTQTIIMPLPPSYYPFTQMKWISTVTWNRHWVYNIVFDGSQNLHVTMEAISMGSVQNDFWWWNDETQEWIYLGSMTQKLSGAKVGNELDINFFAETQTSTSVVVMRETFKMDFTNPLTGEKITQGYSVIWYMIVKYVNGQLQFENSWERRREF